MQETKHCYLAGIITGTPEKADKWCNKYNIPQKNVYNYENFDTIIDNPDITIVYVVLPNNIPAAYTIRAAKAGKHIICEKPMACLNYHRLILMVELKENAPEENEF